MGEPRVGQYFCAQCGGNTYLAQGGLCHQCMAKQAAERLKVSLRNYDPGIWETTTVWRVRHAHYGAFFSTHFKEGGNHWSDIDMSNRAIAHEIARDVGGTVVKVTVRRRRK